MPAMLTEALTGALTAMLTRDRASTRRTVTSTAVSETRPAGRRDDAQLVQDLSFWGVHHFSLPHWKVVELGRPSSGWANETLVVTISGGPGGPGDERLVVRLPPMMPVFPVYDLGAQARVLDALASESVPVPRVVAFEEAEHWLGAPFLVMSYEEGRAGPEAPTVDPWLLGAPIERQRHLHGAFVEMLASVHRVDWLGNGLGGVLRGGDAPLAAEVGWWVDYVQWATNGSPPSRLAQAVAWCAETAPQTDQAPSLCWGDARIGNVLYSDDFEIRAVLDWELASVGPPEMDVGWYLALDGLVELFTGKSVPGFMRRDDVIAGYERVAGRVLEDIEWHELFALTRSVAVSERLSIVAALGGTKYLGGGGNESPVLQELARRIDAFGVTRLPEEPFDHGSAGWDAALLPPSRVAAVRSVRYFRLS